MQMLSGWIHKASMTATNYLLVYDPSQPTYNVNVIDKWANYKASNTFAVGQVYDKSYW